MKKEKPKISYSPWLPKLCILIILLAFIIIGIIKKYIEMWLSAAILLAIMLILSLILWIEEKFKPKNKFLHSYKT